MPAYPHECMGSLRCLPQCAYRERPESIAEPNRELSAVQDDARMEVVSQAITEPTKMLGIIAARGQRAHQVLQRSTEWVLQRQDDTELCLRCGGTELLPNGLCNSSITSCMLRDMGPRTFRPIQTVGQFGFEVRRLRKSAGLTQAQLAEQAGVSRRWISRVERGHLGAELDNIMRVARALGFTIRFDETPGP